ncbi:uncharacterized protein [Miscanthus floridulus]|uniref:uncharacterized protein n=1 Tax=Miscanthus floridulus TaxID=154761 RepID=UPI003459648D
MGIEQNPHEAAIYRRGKGGNALLVGVYVEDLMITGTKDAEVAAIKEEMKATFQMSDLGPLSYLGIEVHQDDSEITLRQTAYAKHIPTALSLHPLCSGCARSAPAALSIPSPSVDLMTAHTLRTSLWQMEVLSRLSFSLSSIGVRAGLQSLRAAHKLSSKLKRDIILGSSSLDDPPQFITKLKLMPAEELTLDDLQL